jgi:DNA-directed RNA polymerase specialized sigma subunit
MEIRKERLRQLEQRERKIVEMRRKNMPFSVIAATLGISRQRAHAIYAAATERGE